MDAASAEPPAVRTDALLVGALRGLLRATTEEQVVGLIAEALGELGATLSPPTGHPDELPLDVSFGRGPPMVPTGPRHILDEIEPVLPGLVEDARVAMDRVRRQLTLIDLASTDVLTGLPNRRIAMRILDRMRPGGSLAMIDLDHFKQVNDSFGHDAGDQILRAFGQALRTAVRAFDTPARFGGEEFLLLLPEVDSSGAVTVLSRLKEAWGEVRPRPVTFSAGVANIVAADTPRSALHVADAALYRAKAAGRNRVEVGV